MRFATAIVVLALFAPAAVAARARAAAPAPIDLSRILWIGAHPDDESLVAPLLGAECAERGSECLLLVMTRGENGPCALASGCSDLASLRTAEMAAAAALLDARVEQWQLPDVFDPASEWDAAAGSHAELVARVQSAIRAFAPTAIFTFDPAHGTTCHPAHRYAGQLVLEAAPPARVFALESRARVEGDRYVLSSAVANLGGLVIFDGGAWWHYLVDDLRAHASQFDAAAVDSLQSAPDTMLRFSPLPRATPAMFAGPPCE